MYLCLVGLLALPVNLSLSLSFIRRFAEDFSSYSNSIVQVLPNLFLSAMKSLKKLSKFFDYSNVSLVISSPKMNENTITYHCDGDICI